MKIVLIAVGTKMPAWINEGFNEYQKRLPAHMKLHLLEITPDKRTGNEQKSKEKEGLLIQNALPKKAYIIALDEHGREYTSLQLAQQVEKWQALGRDVAIIIGGPNGLTKEIKDQADELISLSQLTLPHPLVRLVLAEAIYRAWSIVENLPYHRE